MYQNYINRSVNFRIQARLPQQQSKCASFSDRGKTLVGEAHQAGGGRPCGGQHVALGAPFGARLALVHLSTRSLQICTSTAAVGVASAAVRLAAWQPLPALSLLRSGREWNTASRARLLCWAVRSVGVEAAPHCLGHQAGAAAPGNVSPVPPRPAVPRRLTCRAPATRGRDPPRGRHTSGAACDDCAPLRRIAASTETRRRRRAPDSR